MDRMVGRSVFPRLLVLMLVSFGMIASLLGSSAGAAGGRPRPGKPTILVEHDHQAVDRAAEKARCATTVDRQPGLGRVCVTQKGLFRARISKGVFATTHGFDGESREGNGAGPMPAVTPRNPVCSAGDAIVAVIAHPSDDPGDETVASMRDRIAQINAYFYNAAVESGSSNGANLRFRCDAGQVQVSEVTLPTPTDQATWDSLNTDMWNAGFNKSNEKYVVWYDALFYESAASGIGTYWSDESDTATNANNGGGKFYGFAFDSSTSTLMHEMGHLLGAVGAAAPYSTGDGGHCYQAYDVMCYNDGGSLDPGTLQYDCLDVTHFDCAHDTYFDAKIGSGEGAAAHDYLDDHWNIGECYVRWVVNNACTGDNTPPVVTVPTQQVNGTLSATVPVKVSWSASDASGVAGYSVWVSTNGAAYSQVTLPTATTTALIFQLTPGSSYSFAVAGSDTVGNWSAYQYGPSMTPGVTDDRALPAGAYTGGHWTTPSWTSAYKGTLSVSSTSGDNAHFAFTGRNIALVSTTSTNRGKAWIYLDGTYYSTIDLYSATTVAKKVVFAVRWPSSGQHTIDIRVVGTATRPAVEVDAIVVLG